MNDEKYISGIGFAKISDFIYDDRYVVNFDSAKVQENDIVSLNLDLFHNFLNQIRENPPKNKFILITQNSDTPFSMQHYELIKNYTTKIYALNNTIFDGNINVQTIPIGFRDWPYDTMKILMKIEKETMFLEKEYLLYLNIAVETNFEKRLFCRDYFSSLDWVYKKNKIPLEEYYVDLKKSKYVISPEGRGMDCHRIYECLAFDAIPILKTSILDPFYKKLPVIILPEWTDVSQTELNDEYEKNYEKLKKWKNENPNWMHPKFWLV